ncbi:hypothetical protein DXC31_19320 [Mediterraneibacter gnavus]|uniref:Uncharacterized protein n=1 Tax=Mediterraneibacter gnavus TaxID=33038 RepID=A0A2N5NH58_MEDGN|nr:hypothetical protein CDL22_10350 [Mediterraneibacter gnavus]PLT54498.1 hypothetical protein CDL18_09490 [Mediterraneibacter gnavus]RGM11487.1 hypothetical protein DXC31_19320 [Mediterraneibacter gnavus]
MQKKEERTLRQKLIISIRGVDVVVLLLQSKQLQEMQFAYAVVKKLLLVKQQLEQQQKTIKK